MTLKNITEYREQSLSGLRITPEAIYPLIDALNPDIFDVNEVGKSEEGRPIYRVKFGSGPKKLLLWTQMHGDESTATKSVFDLFNIVNNNMFTKVNNLLLQKCTVYVIPMLNPDGAERYTRENAHGFDLNRDAKNLKFAEAQILIAQVKEIQPDFAFNLHDQTCYYNIDAQPKVATMSFLAPAYDVDKSINHSRSRAMSVISGMVNELVHHIPGHIGRYNDTYCDNCFGDTIQSLGFSTILIECGYFPGDINREFTRDLHTLALLEAFKIIYGDELPDYNAYFEIPMNEKSFYDVLYTNIVYNEKLISIGVRYKIVYKDGEMCKIIDPEEEIIPGDSLDNYFFHDKIDAKGQSINNFLMIKI